MVQCGGAVRRCSGAGGAMVWLRGELRVQWCVCCSEFCYWDCNGSAVTEVGWAAACAAAACDAVAWHPAECDPAVCDATAA